jgi:hypothetical protein
MKPESSSPVKLRVPGIPVGTVIGLRELLIMKSDGRLLAQYPYRHQSRSPESRAKQRKSIRYRNRSKRIGVVTMKALIDSDETFCRYSGFVRPP